jgi:hypothetical protein
MFPMGQTQTVPCLVRGKAQMSQVDAEEHWMQPPGQAVQAAPSRKNLIWQPWQLVALVVQVVQDAWQGVQVVAPVARKEP